MMLESAESKHPRLTNREITFRESNLCDHHTSLSQTDGQTSCHGNAALCVCVCVALHGKNYHCGSYASVKLEGC